MQESRRHNTGQEGAFFQAFINIVRSLLQFKSLAIVDVNSVAFQHDLGVSLCKRIIIVLGLCCIVNAAPCKSGFTCDI